MTIYLFDGTMDGLLTAVITGSVPLITGAVPLIIFDPYSTFVPLRKKCPSVLPIGASQHQLLAHPSTNYSCGNQYLITSYFIKALHHQRILM